MLNYDVMSLCRAFLIGALLMVKPVFGMDTKAQFGPHSILKNPVVGTMVPHVGSGAERLDRSATQYLETSVEGSGEALAPVGFEDLGTVPNNDKLSGSTWAQQATRGFSGRSVSFYAQAVDGSEPIINVNAQRLQNPASVIKLVTTFAALKYLGADYRWHTALLSPSLPNSDGVIADSLVLKGSGDPQLVIERVQELVTQLKNSGVHQIQGPLWIDRSAFVRRSEGPADFDGAADKPYNALPDAALINFHALAFKFNPEERRVSMVPAMAGFDVSQSVQWVEAPCPIDGWKSNLIVQVLSTAAHVGGVYYSGCGTQEWFTHAHAMSSNQYTQGVFAALFNGRSDILADSCLIDRLLNTLTSHVSSCLLKSVNWAEPVVRDWSGAPINVKHIGTGRVVGADSEGWHVLAQVASPPLARMVKDMNFFSNNVMARQIYLSLSRRPSKSANLQASAQVVRGILTDSGLETVGWDFGNGSGLSKYTRISAQGLAQMLIQADSMPEFTQSLPRIGLEGTVRNRLLGTDMVGRGRIKTGTLNDVRAIAGYVDGVSGRRYAVVSIIQDERAQTPMGKNIHDQFMQWVGAH